MNATGQTICLAMIVKNEAPVIRRCLDSVRPIIDHWVIVDTGSTDGTQDIIREHLKDLPGELHERPWRDFAHNRSEALELARPHGDYSLIIDADDTLEFEPDFRLPVLSADAYTIHIIDTTIVYQRMQMVSNALPWRYEGVLHEFLTCEAGKSIGFLGGVVMRRNHDGARRRDPRTYFRDAEILENALLTEPSESLRVRYTFYLAQSYKDSGQSGKALENYLRRADQGHWDQEVYVSLCEAAALQHALGSSADEIMATYRRAIEVLPTRIEAYHGASRYLRSQNRFEEGYQIARPGLNLQPSSDGLFVNLWIYQYGLLDEYAVNAYFSGHYEECLAACERILALPAMPADVRQRVETNATCTAAVLGRSRNAAGAGGAAPGSGGWRPDQPMGGTELMAAGLRRQLGPTLDAINLWVNGYDETRLDHRPLVVWIHHDIDQAAIQWLADREKVRRVARFVFVSHWQMVRYIQAFQLPPDRCVVLKNATIIDRPLRAWNPGPVRRLAYVSAPFRGLDVLLEAWDRLKPGNAELHIWSSLKLYGQTGDDTPYEALFARARALPNVFHHGIVPNEQLREELRGIDYLAYPSTFAETSCLSVIEAMAAGCRVICPALGALPETTAGFARLYPWQPDRDAHAAVFADILAEELARPWEGRVHLGWQQQVYCHAFYDWAVRAGEWRRLVVDIGDGSAPGRKSEPARPGRVPPVTKDGSPTVYMMVSTKKSLFYTQKALDSFFTNTTLYQGDRFLLIANDHAVSELTVPPDVECVENANPKGFAENINVTISVAQGIGGGILVLNNDMIFTKDWNIELLKHNDRISIPLCNQQFQYAQGGLIMRPSMDWGDFSDRYDDLEIIRERHVAAHSDRDIPPDILMSFYCFYVPPRILNEVGRFDEGFGAGGAEDVDYRIRVLLAGYDVVYAPRTYVLHFMGKSTWRSGEDISKTAERNAEYRRHFIAKWGEGMSDFFLAGGNYQRELERPGLSEMFARRDFRSIVRSFCGTDSTAGAYNNPILDRSDNSETRQVPRVSKRAVRRVFDCLLYSGEARVLEIRLHELDAVVDRFVVVESDTTFSGEPKRIEFDPTHPAIAPYAHKIAHVLVSDMPETKDPWVREAWQRNAMLRGVGDATDRDLILMSDVDEIPRASVVTSARDDEDHAVFFFRLAFYYFFVNYRNVKGPEVHRVWNCAATRSEAGRLGPQSFRRTVPPGARVFDDAGWHFSYLTDEAGVKRKISSFSHQELNTDAVLSAINIPALVRRGADLYNRPGYEWALTDGSELPQWLQDNRLRFPVPSDVEDGALKAAPMNEKIYAYLRDLKPGAELRVVFGGHWATNPGWLILDWSDQDITTKLAFDEATVDVVFSEHVLEHLPFAGAVHFLQDALRILKPGGVFRLVCPLLDRLLQVDLSDNLGQTYIRNSLVPYYKDEHALLTGTFGLSGIYDAPNVFLFNSMFRMHDHQFIWSSGLLIAIMKAIGYQDIHYVQVGQGFRSDYCIERRRRGIYLGQDWQAEMNSSEIYDPESGVIEARKAGLREIAEIGSQVPAG